MELEKNFEKLKCRESVFQENLAKYLDYMGALWNHTPNEIKAKPQYMKKRRKQGVKKGFPDNSIYEPNKYYKGLFIELKTGGNSASIEQEEWINNLNKNGYLAFVSYSLEECMYVYEHYKKNAQFFLDTEHKFKYKRLTIDHSKTFFKS